jgi:hypothetical protein
MPRPSDSEIYQSYVSYCQSIGVSAASFESWSQVGVYLTQEEIQRHEADKFLSKLHPDGANLAGLRDGKVIQ